MTTTRVDSTSEDAVPPGPAIDPRIEARRLDVERASSQRRTRTALVIASVCIVAVLAYLTVHSPLLDVDHLHVVATPHVSAAAVRAASRVDLGDALYDIDAQRVAHRIETLPWVASARVHRAFPNTVRISVTEYVPTAYLARGDGTFALIARDGRVFATAPVAPADAVEVRGVRRAPAVGRALSPAGVAGVTGRLPERLALQVTAVDVTHPDVVTLVLRRGGGVRLGTLDHLDAKGAAALAVLDRLGTETFAYIDVRAPSAPVVGGAGR